LRQSICDVAIAAHVGEALVATLKPDGELPVIQAEQGGVGIREL
jgi:hypothetical protein